MTRLSGARKLLVEGVSLLAGALTIAGAASWFAGAVWPVGVVVAETIGLALFAWIAISRFRTPRREADQRRLDEVLGLLSRPSMRRIARADFTRTWPSFYTYPASLFSAHFNEVENRFEDRGLERRRVALHHAAYEFVTQEGRNAVDCDHPAHGVPVREAGGGAASEESVRSLSDAIFRASRDVLAAHSDLVESAKNKGYDLSALAGEAGLHPQVKGLMEEDANLLRAHA
jgi:hypothetical protein